MNNRERLLVVDDEENIRLFLRKLLSSEGYEVEVAASGEEAVSVSSGNPFDLFILDLFLPGQDGLATLRRLRRGSPDAPCIIITAHGTIPSAVDAIKSGAEEYVTKPFRAEEILHAVSRALERIRLSREVARLRRELEDRYGIGGFIGKSVRIAEMLRQVERVAASVAPVLIYGESGTGKELLARAIHFASPRRKAPFVVIDCTAIPENIQESELFGHAKGAFTGAVALKRGLLEDADGGTVFLDEVGDLMPATQGKLLRALQQGTFRRVGDNRPITVDVRVVSATNKDLAEEIRHGHFREDLFYRLSVVRLEVPPLRERREDIPILAEHFLERAAKRGASRRRITPEVLNALLAWDWPGNVRELENAIERACLLSQGEALALEDLPPEVTKGAGELELGEGSGRYSLAHALARMSRGVERQMISRALSACKGNRTEAARSLGVSRRTLLYKMKRLHIK
ncbi:MAG: sigma-54-dependent Fis family transcriptional regulator [Candidatus Tectomicrobia bacterium]|uniref:Sigma-54-dependent Fis family transcriptional regulator n=1 Tax=Tectimicrobiota bacterium TaxID=2528274 RepID=A0A932MNK2_UNCTE|nr:sigma-54-dependent Fis family transcriptional regulator [Candidatus Tectomicrobia bacterium]